MRTEPLLFFRAATLEEHKTLLQIAKQSKYTKDFSNAVMFSSPAAYEKGWIRVCEAVNLDGKRVVGFTCCRVKKRVPEVVLYFVGVDRLAQRLGVGWRLLVDMMENAPPTHRTLTLNVHKDNRQAIDFYTKHGFEATGTALKGEGIGLRKVFE